MNPHMLPKIRSKSVMSSAAGKPCTLRVSSLVPGHRCSGADTVVGVHLPIWGKGTSTKVTDAAVVYGCYNCHAIVDGVDLARGAYLRDHYPVAVVERMLHALTETQAMQIEAGILVYPDAEMI